MRRAPSVLLVAAAAVALLDGACRPPEAPAPPAASAPSPAVPAAPCDPPAVASYRPLPAPTASATLPELPASLDRPEREGEDFTVWGIKKALRLPGGAARLAGREVAVVGLVVATNFAEAPACALHPAGKADPARCVAPLPAFFLADAAGETRYRLKVMGFASRWSSLVSAAAQGKTPRLGPFLDPAWTRPVPFPLPAVGARLRVVGRMGPTFGLSVAGIEVDEAGILTYLDSARLSPAPAPAALGKKR